MNNDIRLIINFSGQLFALISYYYYSQLAMKVIQTEKACAW